MSTGFTNDATLDIDAMLFDVSGRMARAQLARQISSGSATSIKRSARVFKVNSTGNSPQNITRRRTSSTHRSSRHRSDIYNHIPIPPQPTTNYGQQGQEPARPVSWHPSTRTPNRSSGWTTSYYAPGRYSMGDHQSLALDSFPQPVPQSEVESTATRSTHYSMDGSSIACQSTAMSLYESNLQSLNLDTSYQSCMASDTTNHQYTDMTMLDGFPAFSPNSYSTQTWAESLSAFPTYTTPPTPDFLPIQHPSDMWQGYMHGSVPPIPRKPSKELVGMGLYDDIPDRGSFSLESAFDGHFGDVISHAQLERTGKGLKLEETWQPPEDEDDEGEEDDEDEDEDELEEVKSEKASEAVKQEAPTSSEPTTTQGNPPTTYGDLSNQSFFFDSDDSYFDNIGFANVMPAMPPSLGTVGMRDINWV